MDDRVAVGVALVATWPEESLALPAVVDRLEAVADDPRVVRAILDRAEAEGLLERTAGTVELAGPPRSRREPTIVETAGSFTCRRCGTGLSTGYVIRLEAGDLGPFGSTCIRHVTGRK